jgi:hypothetical protein
MPAQDAATHEASTHKAATHKAIIIIIITLPDQAIA